MNTLKQVMTELKRHGNEQTKKTYLRHGIPKDMYGVKVADLKTIAQKIKGKQSLACDLFDTGNFDAMYLAGLVADGSQMTKKKIEEWAKASHCSMISEYAVPWVAHESTYAQSLATKWIKSKKETLASSGWCTYGGIVATTPDEELDFDEIRELLDRVVDEIESAPNRVKYTMNGFVIAVGAYVKPLTKDAKLAAKEIGKVAVDVGDTACKVPVALEYIQKIESMGRVGQKRKTARC